MALAIPVELAEKPLLRNTPTGRWKQQSSTEVRIPIYICQSVSWQFWDSIVYCLDHFSGVLATKHILFAIFKSDEKAVGGFAIISEIFAKVILFEPAIPTEPSSTATNSFCAHSRRAQSYICNVCQGYGFCLQRSPDSQTAIIQWYRQRHKAKCW